MRFLGKVMCLHRKISWILLLLPFMASLAIAQNDGAVYSVRESVSINVSKSLFGSGPSAEVKSKALESAFENAWTSYLRDTQTQARAELYLRFGSELRKQASQICSIRVTSENYDEKASKYFIEVRGTCDIRKTEAILKNLTGSTQQAKQNSGNKPGFVFVFLARRASDATIFQDKTSKERSVTVETTGNETSSDSSRNSGGGSTNRSNEGGSVTQTQRTESKGTVQQRDTAYKYKVEMSDGVDNAVTGILSNAGFEVVKYSDVIGTCPGPSLDEVVRNFSDPKPDQAEVIPAQLRSRMIAAAKKPECNDDIKLSFFSVALLDILKSENRPDGLVRVTVALTMDVRDIRRSLATSAAAIPSVQYQALGKDRIEAANNALRMAAERGTQEVADMLRGRGLN